MGGMFLSKGVKDWLAKSEAYVAETINKARHGFSLFHPIYRYSTCNLQGIGDFLILARSLP
jgi:hypothetical protein